MDHFCLLMIILDDIAMTSSNSINSQILFWVSPAFIYFSIFKEDRDSFNSLHTNANL